MFFQGCVSCNTMESGEKLNLQTDPPDSSCPSQDSRPATDTWKLSAPWTITATAGPAGTPGILGRESRPCASLSWSGLNDVTRGDVSEFERSQEMDSSTCEHRPSHDHAFLLYRQSMDPNNCEYQTIFWYWCHIHLCSFLVFLGCCPNSFFQNVFVNVSSTEFCRLRRAYDLPEVPVMSF